MKYYFYKLFYFLYLKTFLKKIISFQFISNINRYLINKKQNDFKGMNNNEVFDLIYKKKYWNDSTNLNNYSSGLGTENKNTEQYIYYLNNFISSNNINSIVDIGCGDFKIGKRICEENKFIKYTGIDVSSIIIENNTNFYANENINFKCIDASKKDLPIADLCCIRQVLQHINNNDIIKILNNVKQFKYVLITEHLPIDEFLIKKNNDKLTGPDIRIYDGSGVFISDNPFNISCKEVLTYREDVDYIKAEMITFLVEN